MHLDLYMILGSAIVGLLVGLTGAGGGALMTPMLILLFNVTPSSAISSDLVAAVLMRPFGAGMHLHKGTVNLRMVGWMVIGSVPMAFLGTYLLHLLGAGGAADQTHVELALGVALLIGAGAMVLRYVLDRRAGHKRLGTMSQITVRPLPTIAIGMVGGLIVGLTSVGSGSLMIVLLLFVYPLLGANQLVGTDLTQAVPLTMAAAAGALIWGTPVFGVTASIVIGSVPAVLIGSYFSSRAPDRYIRPIITFVIFASGLKYVGVPTTALGIVLATVAVVGLTVWLVRTQPWRGGQAAVQAAGHPAAGHPAAEQANGAPVPAPVTISTHSAATPASTSTPNGSARFNGSAWPDGSASPNGSDPASGAAEPRDRQGPPPNAGID